MKIVLGLVLVGIVLAGCGFLGAGNQPGITSDPKEAAIAVYPENPSADEQAALTEDGKSLFQSSGCVNCHSPTRDGGNLQGPPLAGVSAKYTRIEGSELKARRWLVMHIKSPQEYPGNLFQTKEYPNFMPPNHNITDADMKKVVEYLWMLN